VRGDEQLPGEIQLIHVPGKSPGEIAFHLPRSRALIVGDVVIGVPVGELSTYPDKVIDDMEQLHRSAARLLEYDFDALLLCDGEPLPSGGKQKLREFVEGASA
jgi:glyoxylase-like metal-dependent hydrolase (beta-lactamase superfamily II)